LEILGILGTRWGRTFENLKFFPIHLGSINFFLTTLLPWMSKVNNIKGYTPKKYEEVVTRLLQLKYIPTYTVLPTFSLDWDGLTPGSRPGEGGRLPSSRSPRKRWQIRSMVALVNHLLPAPDSLQTAPVIVDFCGGSGHVGIVLAEVFPRSHVIICDIHQRSLDIARERVEQNNIKNVELWCGNITKFNEPFHVGVALHA